jgi:MoxR-like ATPase
MAWGKPGVGKSDAVRKAAKLHHHAALADVSASASTTPSICAVFRCLMPA